MAHKAESARDPDKDPPAADEPVKKKLYDFILLATTAIGALVAVLLAAFHTLTVWTVLLVVAGFLLALLLVFGGLTETRWFYPATAWVVVAALIVSGIYIAVEGKQTHIKPSQLAGNVTKPPKLQFVLSSPATVPWCNTFKLTTKGVLPQGYEILVFDASIDGQQNVSSFYSYDGVAIPVNRVAGEWTIKLLYVASRYKVNAKGQTIYRNGHPVSNAGYTVGVFAVLVPDSDGTLLHGMKAPHSEWALNALPPNFLANARLNTIRNGDTRQCLGVKD